MNQKPRSQQPQNLEGTLYDRTAKDTNLATPNCHPLIETTSKLEESTYRMQESLARASAYAVDKASEITAKLEDLLELGTNITKFPYKETLSNGVEITIEKNYDISAKINFEKPKTLDQTELESITLKYSTTGSHLNVHINETKMTFHDYTIGSFLTVPISVAGGFVTEIIGRVILPYVGFNPPTYASLIVGGLTAASLLSLITYEFIDSRIPHKYSNIYKLFEERPQVAELILPHITNMSSYIDEVTKKRVKKIDEKAEQQIALAKNLDMMIGKKE